MKHVLLALLGLVISQPLYSQCYQNGIPCGQSSSTGSTGGSGSTGGGSSSNTTLMGSDGNTTTPVATDSSGRLITSVYSLPSLPSGSNVIGSISNTTFGVTQSGPWSIDLNGPLPAFASTPTFNIGNLNGAASDSSIVSLKTSLGNPFQQNGSIGNTKFGSTQDGSWHVSLDTGTNVIGSISNTSFGSTQSGTWNVGLTGPLPSFSSTPTFNIGTTNGIALDTTVSSLFKAGQSIGNTTFASTVASGANVDLFALRNVIPTSRGQQTSANSLGVTLSSDGTYAKTSDITALQTQLHTDLIASIPAGTATIGNVFRATPFNETTTALAANATFNPSTPRDSGAVGSQTTANTFSCFVRADQAGTVNQQGSNDGTTWYTELSGSLSANVSLVTTGRVFTRYHRCQVINGTTAQTSLIVNSQLGE